MTIRPAALSRAPLLLLWRRLKLLMVSVTCGLLLVVPVLVLTPRLSAAVQPGEDHVKAVFLYNLIHFVTWPEHPGSSFIIGIIDDPAFAEIVAEAVRGEAKGTMAVEVRSFASVEEALAASSCLLFIGGSRSIDLPQYQELLMDKPVLTVGDQPDFSRQGGMVGLVRSSNRINIEINLQAVEDSGLSVSSKLLTLARLVR